MQLYFDASFWQDLKVVLGFHIVQQSLSLFYDHTECHASQISFFDCTNIVLAIFPAISINLF